MSAGRDLTRWPRLRPPVTAPGRAAERQWQAVHPDASLLGCPFRVPGRPGVAISACPGYALELVGVRDGEPAPRPPSCAHLRPPGRQAGGHLAVCGHGDAPQIVLRAQRLLADASA